VWSVGRDQRKVRWRNDGGMVGDDRGLHALTSGELEAVVGVVRALAMKDVGLLRSIGAYDGNSDPYLWTRDHGDVGDVEIVVPPGEPRDWSGEVMQWETEPGFCAVIVDMWTAQEGPSDLSLELELTTAANGSTVARFKGLHVM
jgi:hypothetical protein